MIGDRLRLRVPVESSARPIRMRRHNTRDRMGEAVAYGSMGLLAAAEALKPVGHVPECQVADGHGLHSALARYGQIPAASLFVDIRIVLMIAPLFHDLVSRTALATDIEQRRFLAHVAR